MSKSMPRLRIAEPDYPSFSFRLVRNPSSPLILKVFRKLREGFPTRFARGNGGKEKT
jgi:hypothetical protein